MLTSRDMRLPAEMRVRVAGKAGCAQEVHTGWAAQGRSVQRRVYTRSPHTYTQHTTPQGRRKSEKVQKGRRREKRPNTITKQG
jgi:hypothetical protein